ncbi:hypothetical protein ACWCYY_40320 [Kitasatospora sp. NPDC001664]
MMFVLLLLLLSLATVEIVWLGSQGRHRGARQVLRDGSKPVLPARHRRDRHGPDAEGEFGGIVRPGKETVRVDAWRVAGSGSVGLGHTGRHYR